MTELRPRAVVFDLGGVLLDWNPRYLYRTIFPDNEEEMEWFLGNVCTQDWNATHDEGRPFSDGIAELTQSFPEYANEIAAYRERWPEMLGGSIEETVAMLEKLSDEGVPLYALSNWSSETFQYAASYPFMSRFDGQVVSGFEGVKKPAARIFEILIDRYELDPGATFFIDDVVENVEAARALGILAHHFRSPDALDDELRQLGLLQPA